MLPHTFNCCVMKKNLLLLCILLIIPSIHHAQNWPKIIDEYQNNSFEYVHKVLECYDKGYLMIADTYDPYPFFRYIWLLKTDINGERIWDKKIGNNINQFNINDIEKTNDGGCVLIGATTLHDEETDPMIVKLNACMQIEWCKVFHSSGYNSGRSIELTNNGYLALIRYHGGQYDNKRVFLFKLDMDGEIIWQNVYAQDDPLIWNEEGYDLYITHNNHYVITGECDYPMISGGDTSIQEYIRPLVIYVDSMGNQLWDMKWGYYEISHGVFVKIKEKEPGWFYTVDSYMQAYQVEKPSLHKFDNEGQEQYLNYMFEDPDMYRGGSRQLEFLNDSTMVVDLCWTYTPYPLDEGYSEIMTNDTFGNLLNRRLMMEEYNSFTDFTLTYDNKILAVGNFNGSDKNNDIYLWKLNHNLEDDSLYNQPLVYDSLCPHPIVSDTIDCNCTVVNMDEYIITKEPPYDLLKIYPNPAKNKIIVGNWYMAEHAGCTIRIHNLTGRLVLQQPLLNKSRQTEVNISQIKPGVYMVSLWHKSSLIGREKLMVID